MESALNILRGHSMRDSPGDLRKMPFRQQLPPAAMPSPKTVRVVRRHHKMKQYISGTFTRAVAVLLIATWGCTSGSAPSASESAAPATDRTVLPLAEPSYPAITELDVRKATAPPLFQVKAPPGAPNVIVILLDNLGFGATKPFGGVINMPTLERLAKDGLIYTNFHTAPLCSPSRMALLTGRNPHSVNMGSVSEISTAFPGNSTVRPNSKAPLAEILKLNGYSTAMFGKSHEFTPWETGLTGPFDRWPTGSGFERFYGVLSAEADNFAPVLHDNLTLVDVPNDPKYYYPTDLADHAISWIRTQKSLTPDKPFFIYYASPGTHAPSQVPTEWRDKYKGKFEMGWDKYPRGNPRAAKASGHRPAQHAAHAETYAEGDA